MARQPELAYAGAPRVDLMPKSETDRRERESLTRKWVWGVVGVVVLAVLIIAGAWGLTWVANQRYAASQAETSRLVTQIAGLSDVSSALATQRELKQFRSEAMGADFAWAPVVSTITGALPADVSMVSFNVTTGGQPVTGTKPEDAVGLTGTYTFTSVNPIDMGATVRALRGAKGIMFADGTSLTSSGARGGQASSAGQYQYLLTVTFNQTIYSGQYAVKAAK